jgi:hypothetical protein
MNDRVAGLFLSAPLTSGTRRKPQHPATARKRASPMLHREHSLAAAQDE